MKKKTKVLLILYFIFVGIIVFTSKDVHNLVMDVSNSNASSNTGAKLPLDYVGCGSAEHIPKPIPQLTTIAYTILVTGTPLVLIVFSIIALVKATAGGNADDINKAKNSVIKKFVAAGIIFVLAGLFQFILNKVTTTEDDKNTVTSCLKCFLFYSSTNCPTSDSGNDGVKKKYRSQINDPVNTSNKNGYVMYIGDSRTIGMCKIDKDEAVNVGYCRSSSDIVNAKVGAGYDWFTTTGVGNADTIIKRYSHQYKILILMGINDIWDDSVNEAGARKVADKYYDYIKNKATNASWKKAKVIIVTITKVQNAEKQKKVSAFNDQMKKRYAADNASNIKYCNLSSTEFEYASDGLHYTSEGYQKMYEAVSNYCISQS